MQTMKSKLVGLAVALTVIGSLFTASVAEAGRVNGYFKKDGTYVRSHSRTNPDRNPYNNYSYPGNYNPNTGKTSAGNPNTYVERYNTRKSELNTPYNFPGSKKRY
jgi:uncharacterized protein YxeA